MKSWSKLFLLALAVAMLAAIPASADWQTASVGLGNNIQNVAIDPVRNRIFTANYLSGTVTMVNGQTNSAQNWACGVGPVCLAVNPITGKLYVSINGSATNDTVVVFDTLGAIVGRLPVKRDPMSMVADADSNRLYVANYNSDTISVFRNDVFLADIPVKDAPNNMALNPVNRTIYLAYNTSDSVACINMDALSRIHIRSGLKAYGVSVCASVNKAYVANMNEDSVAVINCATNTVVKKIPVGLNAMPFSLVSDPAAQQVYVANQNTRTISAINCITDAVYSAQSLNYIPSRLSINPITRKLYVSSGSSNDLKVIDYRNGGMDSLVLGHTSGVLAVNPVTNKIYVAMECGATDSLTVIDGSDYDTTITVAKSGTQFTAVNPITGDAFFSNSNSDNVTVIKATGDTVTITVGDDPRSLAVNPLTNKIFVCNFAGKSVSVINGATYTVERTITVDTLPTIVAVNPLTNYIYVNSFFASANRIKVIDGKDWDTSSVLVGSKPFSIAVNPATNRIYVGNDVSNTVSVIDGARHTVITSVSVNRPYKMDINPVTNKIYAAKLQTSGQVAVIDGATNTSVNVTVGNWPSGVAVNRANNKIYVTNANDSTVSEIDGVTNAVTTIKVGAFPEWIAADPVTGKVFVSNSNGGSLSIIDCASRSVKTMAMPTGPRQVALNPANGKVYLACFTVGRVVVIDQTVEQDTKLIADVNTYFQNNREFETSRPGIFGKAVNRWDPNSTAIKLVLNNLNTAQNAWNITNFTPVAIDSVTWDQYGCWGSNSLSFGENYITYLALDGQAATTNNGGVGTPFCGNMLVYPAYFIDAWGPGCYFIDSLPDDNNSADGYGPYIFKAVWRDFSGIDSAVSDYKINGGSWVGSTRMALAAADTFIGTVPAQTLALGDSMAIMYYTYSYDHSDRGLISGGLARSFKLRNLTGVSGNPSESGIPKTFALQAAYPNPSRGQTVIKYQLPKASNVQLQVYNVAGQLVKTFNEGQKPAGYHQISWKDSKLSNGIYFYQLKAGEFSATRKLVVLK
jgi:YVTN family beta-propeller protein